MIRVRFAPTPSGSLFISGARVALANDLFARRGGGEMLLRLDDLDQERSHPAASNQIKEDLRWFGIEWHETFRQSERLGRYQETIERLKRDKLIYPCFESAEELKAKQEFRRKRNQSPIYDRAMLSLTDKQRQDAEAGGKRPHWRFKLSGRTLHWSDLILGPRHAALSAVSDPILARSDDFFDANPGQRRRRHRLRHNTHHPWRRQRRQHRRAARAVRDSGRSEKTCPFRPPARAQRRWFSGSRRTKSGAPDAADPVQRRGRADRPRRLHDRGCEPAHAARRPGSAV